MIKSRRLSSYLSKSAAIIAVSLLSLSLTQNASAFPIPLGAEFQWVSEDNSNLAIIGPATIRTKKRNVRTGAISDHEIVVGQGGRLVIQDVKRKGGRGAVKTVSGDPLAELEGTIDFGSGIFNLQSTGIDDLFSSSTANLTFNSGEFNAAITLPGDQLIGPDGDDTYINWISSWASTDPIGSFNDGIDDFDIILGSFDLNGISEPAPGIRPFNFSYEFLSEKTGLANFTVLDELVLGGNSYFGQVSKSMRFAVPEPSLLSFLGFSIVGLLGFGSKQTRGNKNPEKKISKRLA